MPIKPENRARYPADWAQISARRRERAGQRCEWCGVANGAIGGRLPDGTFLPAVDITSTLGATATCSDGTQTADLRLIRIVLTCAHLDHTPENCDDDNLRALCQRCHLNYDKHARRMTAK